jgi:hypothetical protein
MQAGRGAAMAGDTRRDRAACDRIASHEGLARRLIKVREVQKRYVYLYR